MSGGLPPVSPEVLAGAVDALPARLRKKIDDTVATAAGWPVSRSGETVTVRVDDAVTVTLTPVGGVVSDAGQVTCCCLLAPRCLHRAAVLARAPIADADAPGTSEVPTAPEGADAPGAGAAPTAPEGADAPAASGADAPAPDSADAAVLSVAQQAAAAGLHRAAVAVLDAGLSGTGTVGRAGLLRCAHEARAVGLHRPAAVARRVAARLQAAQQTQPQYRLADLTNDLRELFGVLRRLGQPGLVGDAAASLIGTARRPYDLRGSLRLYGLCTEPVVAESGHAGVVTYLVDSDGRVWAIADLAPGGVERAATAGEATIRLGEAAVTHRAMTRSGLLVTGATASASGQLGAGRSVRAVSASGVSWGQDPLARLWTEPLDEQVRRAFAALPLGPGERPAGSDLLYLTVRVLGAQDGDVRAVTSEGLSLTLTGPDHEALPCRQNLRVLATGVGAEYLLVGRPDPTRPAAVHPLALAPVGDGAGHALPSSWAGHVDLGYDRLHSSHLPAAPDVPPSSAVGGLSQDMGAAGGDPSLELIRRQVERVVSGGRAVGALARSEEHRLRRTRLDTGATLSSALVMAARVRPRDAFGRLAGDDGAAFADAWLALAIYEDAASRALTEARWHSVLSQGA